MNYKDTLLMPKTEWSIIIIAVSYTHLVGNQNDLIVIEDGGMVDSEMKRLIIAPSFYQIEKEDFEIVLAKISYAKPFGTLNHRDILGALMSLGVKRELFGDIYEYEDNFYVAMDAKIYEYVKNNLIKIKRSKVKILESEEIITIDVYKRQG